MDEWFHCSLMYQCLIYGIGGRSLADCQIESAITIQHLVHHNHMSLIWTSIWPFDIYIWPFDLHLCDMAVTAGFCIVIYSSLWAVTHNMYSKNVTSKMYSKNVTSKMYSKKMYIYTYLHQQCTLSTAAIHGRNLPEKLQQFTAKTKDLVPAWHLLGCLWISLCFELEKSSIPLKNSKYYINVQQRRYQFAVATTAGTQQKYIAEFHRVN